MYIFTCNAMVMHCFSKFALINFSLIKKTDLACQCHSTITLIKKSDHVRQMTLQ